MNSASQVSSKPDRRMPPRTRRVAGCQVVSSEVFFVIASHLPAASRIPVALEGRSRVNSACGLDDPRRNCVRIPCRRATRISDLSSQTDGPGGMTSMTDTDDLFFSGFGLDRQRLDGLVSEALANADDGELFLEYRQSESLVLDDGRLKSAGFDTSHGFGLRAVADEATGYAHATDLGEEAIRRAGEAVAGVCSGRSGTFAPPPPGTNRSLYRADNPLALVPFAAKTQLLTDIDAYARGKDE